MASLGLNELNVVNIAAGSALLHVLRQAII